MIFIGGISSGRKQIEYLKTVICARCGALYELTPEVGRRLSRGEDLEIQESDLTLLEDGRGNPWNRTKKCANCGYETEEDFTYCPKCGNPL